MLCYEVQLFLCQIVPSAGVKSKPQMPNHTECYKREASTYPLTITPVTVLSIGMCYRRGPSLRENSSRGLTPLRPQTQFK